FSARTLRSRTTPSSSLPQASSSSKTFNFCYWASESRAASSLSLIHPSAFILHPWIQAETCPSAGTLRPAKRQKLLVPTAEPSITPFDSQTHNATACASTRAVSALLENTSPCSRAKSFISSPTSFRSRFLLRIHDSG